MRIYEGSPRQDYEEVLRSIGAFIDQRGLFEILLAEAPDGFILQGLVQTTQETSAWADPSAILAKETYTFIDEDAAARRRLPGGDDGSVMAGPYERGLRVIGRYVDHQRPKDVFLFEQGGAYVLRLLMATRQGSRHMLAEFTPEDVLSMVGEGPSFRGEQSAPLSD
jgi:hypothetical protein